MKLRQRLQSWQKHLRDSIDRGISGIERAHLDVAAAPFDTIRKLANGPVKKAHERSQRRIRKFYQAARGLNDRAGRRAAELLARGKPVPTTVANVRGKAKAGAAAGNGRDHSREASRQAA